MIIGPDTPEVPPTPEEGYLANAYYYIKDTLYLKGAIKGKTLNVTMSTDSIITYSNNREAFVEIAKGFGEDGQYFESTPKSAFLLEDIIGIDVISVNDFNTAHPANSTMNDIVKIAFDRVFIIPHPSFVEIQRDQSNVLVSKSFQSPWCMPEDTFSLSIDSSYSTPKGEKLSIKLVVHTAKHVSILYCKLPL